MPRTATSESAASRRSWPPVLWVLLGAVIAVAAVVVIELAGSSDPERAAPATTGPTTTTVAPPAAERVFRTIQPSLVEVLATGEDGSASLGSGVVVNRQGQIMTADHVVEGATDIQVRFADGTTSAAQVVSSEPDRDTAVLAPLHSPGVIVPAVLGGGMRIGDDTYSVGSPLGLSESMTAGVVSGLDRSIEREDGSGSLTGLIQFDAAVNPGSSGGPLLNRQGQVVGIVTALVNPTGQRFFVGIGFAVPIAGGGGGSRVPET